MFFTSQTGEIWLGQADGVGSSPFWQALTSGHSRFSKAAGCQLLTCVLSKASSVKVKTNEEIALYILKLDTIKYLGG